MSESVHHDEQHSSLHCRKCFCYDEQCSSFHTEGLRGISTVQDANLSRYQRSVIYAGTRIFNSLPLSLTSLGNKKAKFKVTLQIYSSTLSFYSAEKCLLFIDDP